MDIERLQKKRQLNVQEQNALERENIVQCTFAYRNREPHLVWVGQALLQNGVDPQAGILAQASSVLCGGREEAGYATWVRFDFRFFAIEATISLETHALIFVDSFRDVTDDIIIDGHQRGQGKSFGYLALEVLAELR